MHAHSWHALVLYPWERGVVYKQRCRSCGKVLKTRYEWAKPAPRRRENGESLGSVGGFLIGVGFATFVFAVAVLRGCVHLPPSAP